ncbi:zinc metalloproteinase nas-6-like [Panonychus citri]|uniref:zinc metalloproteinase nas-6-like n=1 Tax=Panonychus citri TaxID=50023 RepID=UPI002307B58E|nr:zinc metalloproteinase nas-6-like [Panonychus citri]
MIELIIVIICTLTFTSFGAPILKENNQQGKLNLVESTNGLYDPKAFYSLDKFEGDILGSYPSTNISSEASPYHAIVDTGYLWPNGEVVYTIDSSLQNQRSLIKQAMDHITQMTSGCIKFKEKTHESDFVFMYQSQGCYSQVGRQGGSQELSLGRGCHVPGVVIHELLHALGFFHHHSRSDRDRFLRINYQNIDPQAYPQFQKLNDWENQLFTDFDYNSIMIYGSTAFSRDGYSQTMTPINPSGTTIQDPGYKYVMTPSDISSLKKLYKCDKISIDGTNEKKKIEIGGGVWPLDQTTTMTPTDLDDENDNNNEDGEETTIKPIVDSTSTHQPIISWTTQTVDPKVVTSDYSTRQPNLPTISPIIGIPSIPSIIDHSTEQPDDLSTETTFTGITIPGSGKILTPPPPGAELPEPEIPHPVPPFPHPVEKTVWANEIPHDDTMNADKKVHQKYSF